MEIDAAGISVMAGEPVAYLVMEHAEENLAEILRDRPLTTGDAISLQPRRYRIFAGQE